MDINTKDVGLDAYVTDVSDGKLTIISDNDDEIDGNASGQSVDLITSADSVVAITSDGDLVAYSGFDRYDLRAHLAIYDSNNDVLTVLS